MKNTAAKSRYSKILQIYNSQISEGECRCVRKIPMNMHRGLSSEPVHIILALPYFSRAWNWFQVITKHLIIPALFTAYMLFPRFLPLTCFSRAFYRLHAFPALDTKFAIFRAWHLPLVFPRLKPVTRSACSGVITISNDIKHKWVFSSSPSQTIPSKSLIQSFHKKMFFCSLLAVSVSCPVLRFKKTRYM